MGEILGVGVTHYPPLVHPDENMAALLKYFLRSPRIPEQYKRPESWPEVMRREGGEGEGKRGAKRHRQTLGTWVRKGRQEDASLSPELLLMRGGDQYEDFM